MAKKTINLDMTECNNREMRIGTIISWDGKASELVEASNYEQRSKHEKHHHGCPGGKGKACQLCELSTPFSQQTMCANAIVACQAGNLTDCILIEHSPIGCSANHIHFNIAFRIGLQRRGKSPENLKIFSTNLNENDMVFGASDRLRRTIDDAYERYHPKAIFISMSCSTAIIGEDIDSVADEKEAELGIPVVPLHCEGFRSKHWSTGFDVSQHGVARQIVKRNPEKIQKDLINIVALWGTDYFTEILKPLGLRVNYLLDMASYDELQQASEAVATSTFCHTLGSYLSTALEEHFGVPQIDAPMPYGISATDEWLRAIAKVVGKEDIIEDYIRSEHERIQPELDQLKEKLKGLHGFVLTGSAYAHALICALKDLGIEVDGSVVFHHDPVYDSGHDRQNSLKYLVDNYGDIEHFTVSKTQPFQLPGILKRVKTDFVIIRHYGLSPVAAKLGIPALAMGDEHFPMGYNGIIRLGNLILDIVARKKFNKVLSRHTELGYTDWWLSQEDPFVLAHKPELINEPIYETNGGRYDG
ncbi:MAG: nitrogenase [Clostridia bacterium]|nr:nitrogenase [Clostridia bacterium]